MSEIDYEPRITGKRQTTEWGVQQVIKKNGKDTVKVTRCPDRESAERLAAESPDLDVVRRETVEIKAKKRIRS